MICAAEIEVLALKEAFKVNADVTDIISTLHHNFEKYDCDQSGSIDAAEFRKLLTDVLGTGIETCSENDVLEFISALDSDGSGQVEEAEWIAYFSRLYEQNAC